jgi:hypothetical protein
MGRNVKRGRVKGGVLKGGVLKGGVLMRAPFWLHAMFFCKIVARWVYQTHAGDDMAMRCDRMV